MTRWRQGWGLLALGLWLAASQARAGEDQDAHHETDPPGAAGSLQVGLQALPASDGAGGVRLRQGVGLRLGLPGGWTLVADGAFRTLAGEGDPAGDLMRLSLTTSGRGWVASLGRFARVGNRGILRLDGVWSEFLAREDLRVQAWAGRAWSTERSLVFEGDWLAGTEVRVRPTLPLGSAVVDATAGVEGRVSSGAPRGRMFGSGVARDGRGDRVSLDGEVELGGSRPRARAALRGNVVAGRAVDVDGAVRWEDLAPLGTAPLASNPETWLAADGYGAADLGASVCGRSWHARIQGGARLHVRDDGPKPGGSARASAGVTLFGGVPIEVFVATAGLFPSWLAGGGLALSAAPGPLRVSAAGAVYRFQPLDGRAAWVGEVRLRTEARAIASKTGGTDALRVAAELAGGVDRVLVPWLRIGLTLDGVLEPPRRSRR